MNLGDLHKIWEVKALKRKPGEEEARKMLEKIAKQVQPIMKNHKWKVKLLSEFCEGFDIPGRRLGGFSRQPALSSLRQTALAAAENRKRLGSLLPTGPKRLGGDNTIKDALSPIQAAAIVAERRLQDDI
ncbi:DNA damage response protein [Corchorus capsularis]|uniref:DNA damage response protein n=1 Tax=Corchorus capsularis TaxID=210143 RepID=A0A1R3FZ41_COCAP|nr:DNA damage response protein [Corchorus capsularis]